MDWYDILLETIDLRSFSNLWFWIAVAVLWSSASHWVMGVPYDMITRARRQGGGATAEDVDTLVGIYVRRILDITRVAGLWLVGIATFFLSALAILGFYYRVEFAQAVFLLSAPMTLVGALSISTARRISASGDQGAALWKHLMRHRMMVQGIGVVAIFVTAMWGMWQNLNLPLFG